MLEWAVERLLQLIPAMQSVSRDKRELRDNALRALVHALNETHIYYRRRERGKPRSHEMEEQLVRCWSAAAIPLRHIDSELASRCNLKAQFWIHPEDYSSQDVENLGITLEAVRNAYQTLLSPGSLGNSANERVRTGTRSSPNSRLQPMRGRRAERG
jgi:hypothetical protein